MPIVKKLVDLMHGTISIESEEGKGTTVIVNLPHRYIVEDQEVKEVDDKEIDLTGKHILLVEDNNLNDEIAQTLLEDKGIKSNLGKRWIRSHNDGKGKCDELFRLYINGYSNAKNEWL